MELNFVISRCVIGLCIIFLILVAIFYDRTK